MIPIKKPNEKMPIPFVLGTYITGLNLIRNFGRRGYRVFASDYDKKSVGLISKYCKPLIHPNPAYYENEFIDFLIKIGEQIKNEKGVLFPTSDVEVLAILKYKKELDKYYYFTLADYDITNNIVNKELFYHILEKYDILHPKSYYPTNKSDLFEIDKKITYPCFLKPKYSTLFRFAFNKKNFVANNFKELQKYYDITQSKKIEVLIQEIIPGPDTNMNGLNAYYDKNGKANGVFCYKRIRQWPPISGNGCLLEKTSTYELEKIVTPIIKKLNYYGIVDAEFKKDPISNKFYLIEINTRSWMQIGFPARYGYDHAYMAYLDAINKEIQFPYKECELKWLLLYDDFFSALSKIKKDELSLKNWFLSLKGKKEYAFFAWDDPLPFVKLVSNAAFKVKNKGRLKV